MILVYGKGWIGNMVTSYLTEKNIQFLIGQSRLDDLESVKKELCETQASHVICLVGRTHGIIDGKEYSTIDYLEQPGKLYENIRDNLFAQVSLALLCQERKIHLSVIATGCIFNYDGTGKLFTEESLPNFFDSSYSIVKGFTDRLMHLLPCCNMRIRMPIVAGKEKRNFITKILNYSKICSAPNSMTVLEDFIPIMVDLSIKKYVGTINLTNPGTISHNEILQMYKEIVNPSYTWQNFTYEEQVELLKNGRSNNELDTTKLLSMYDIPDIHTSIRRTLEQMK
jgi:3,5-epimerase/4-reductase